MERVERELDEVGEEEFRRRVRLGHHWGLPHGPMQKAAEALMAGLDDDEERGRHTDIVKTAQEANNIAREARVVAWVAILVSVVLAALGFWLT